MTAIMPTRFKMKLAHNLKLVMAQRRITLSELSRATKIPKSSLSDWIAGAPPRKLDQVKRVADHFEMSLDDLAFGDLDEDSDSKPKKKTEKLTEDALGALMGDGWLGGVFEIKLRRIRKEDK
jgi:transcriptional regulator with XRE-family HTH domain